MSDSNVAQRYLSLWVQYLTALLADPRAVETLNRWLAFTGQFAYPPSGGAGGAGERPAPSTPAWPPFFGPFGLPFGPAGAPDGIAELARRVDELERRIAKLETQPTPRRPRARSARGSSR